ncbi:unnamed protein product [Rotaria sp. Silwood2]|nr:unnamed protein product [Rotaria sp. Silwood2]
MSIDDNILLVNTATATDDTLKIDAIVQCSLISLDTISIPIRISTSSHKFCVIRRSDLDGKHATVISESIRLTLLVQHTIYLKPGVRCCKDHLNCNDLKPQGLNMIKKKYPPITSIMINDLMDIINELILQKSTNNLLQRKRFSLHKNRPLIKPMMIMATDGYIISATDPDYADW